MQTVVDGYRGLALLLVLNRDWLVMLGATVAALAGAGYLGCALLPN